MFNTRIETLTNTEIVPGSWDIDVTDLTIYCGGIMEGLWNFAQEKSLSVPILMSCCENLEDNAESNSDVVGMTCEVSEKSKD